MTAISAQVGGRPISNDEWDIFSRNLAGRSSRLRNLLALSVVYGAQFTASSLLYGRLVLPGLQDDAAQMTNVDPTLIAAAPLTPIEAARLVLPAVCVSLVASSASATLEIRFLAGGRPTIRFASFFAQIMQFASLGVFHIIGLSIVTFALLSLCGAPIGRSEVIQTAFAALHLAAMAFLRPSILYGWTRLENYLRLVLGPADGEAPLDSFEVLVRCGLCGAFLGCVVGSVLVPGDWGMQIQRWPLPVVLGSFTFHYLGVFGAVIIEFFKVPRDGNKQDVKEY